MRPLLGCKIIAYAIASTFEDFRCIVLMEKKSCPTTLTNEFFGSIASLSSNEMQYILLQQRYLHSIRPTSCAYLVQGVFPKRILSKPPPFFGIRRHAALGIEKVPGTKQKRQQHAPGNIIIPLQFISRERI